MDTPTKQQTRQDGFGVIAIVVIVVALAVAGFVGWRVYEAYGKPQQSPNQTTQNNSDPNAGYVVIKEWGVRFKPVEGLTGVEYARRDLISLAGVTLPTGSENIVLTTQQLVSLNANCSATASSYSALGTVYKTPSQLNISENTYLGKVDDYYYYYMGAQSACVDKPNWDLESSLWQKVLPSLKTLEAAK